MPTPPQLNSFNHWIREKTTLLGFTIMTSAFVGLYMGTFSSDVTAQMLTVVPFLLIPQNDAGQQSLSALFTAAIAIILRKRKK